MPVRKTNLREFIFNPNAEEFQQQRSIATAERVVGTASGEERLGIAWVSKHPGSEDESVGVGMGWDGLGRLTPAIGNAGSTLADTLGTRSKNKRQHPRPFTEFFFLILTWYFLFLARVFHPYKSYLPTAKRITRNPPSRSAQRGGITRWGQR